MIELKRCPFCGNRAYLNLLHDGSIKVRCEECKAAISKDFWEIMRDSTPKDASQDVVNAWNARKGEE